MARRPENLARRGSTWHLRVRVPDDIRLIVGKQEVWRSLKTSDGLAAKRLVRIERIRVEAEFDGARRKLAAEQARNPVAAQVTLSDAEVWQITARFFASAEAQSNARPLDLTALMIHREELPILEDFDSVAQDVHRHVRVALAEAGIDYPAASAPSGPIKRADGTAVGRSGVLQPAWVIKLHHGIHAALVEGERRRLNRTSSAVQLALNPEFAGITASSAVKPVSKITFSELIKRYEGDRTRAPLSPKSQAKRHAQLRFLVETVGARTLISSIDREIARTVFDAVGRMPANAAKRFPGKSVAYLLALTPEKVGARLSQVTANGYMILFGSVLAFAVAEHLIDRNPALGLRAASDGVAAKDRRLPLSIDDLRKPFNAPLYTGCLNDGAGYAKPGSAHPRRARFWVPLLSLFTGMRMTECLQLTEDDIQTIGDVDLITVRANAEGKRLKTAAATRVIPIHPELKRIGFLELVANARFIPGSRLFPEQTPSAQGDLGSKFSKWFAHMLDSVGVVHPLKNLHSCRHAFRDQLRSAGVSAEVSRALGGWSGGGNTTDEIYGSGFDPRSLANAIEKIGYTGLDLSHLH